MPKFSYKSKSKLQTCDPRLMLLMSEVVKVFDITVLYGMRTNQEQFELFMQGRTYLNGEWKIQDKSKIVTYRDGYEKKSAHNPNDKGMSDAVDVAPYIAGKGVSFNRNQCYYMGGFISCKIIELEMDDVIKWGGDWNSNQDVTDQNFNDLLHFEIK